MKTKTIKAVILKKMSDWWKSIEDEKLRERVQQGTIVTGGCIPSMLLREQVNDYDVYLRSQDLVKDLAQYYVNRFQVKTKSGIDCAIFVREEPDGRIKIVVKSAGVASEKRSENEYFEGAEDSAGGEYVREVMQDPGAIQDRHDETEAAILEGADKGPAYRPVFLSTNAITLSSKVQIVLRFYGEPDEIHKNYDFVHCTNYWSSWDNQLVLRQPALESILTKELKYVGSKYPLCSLFRIRKFVGRGWTINAGQILKMAMQVHDINLHDPMVLEDQLTGVDVAHFADLIHRLKEKDENGEPRRTIDTAYLVEIIDRMF